VSRRYGWAEEDDARLIALWGAGKLIKTIAAELERGEMSVAHRVDQLRDEGAIGFRKAPWSTAERCALAAAIAGGGSYRELARRFGRSKRAVRQQAYLLRLAVERAAAAAGANDDEDQLTLELQAA
jgi:transposase